MKSAVLEFQQGRAKRQQAEGDVDILKTIAELRMEGLFTKELPNLLQGEGQSGCFPSFAANRRWERYFECCARVATAEGAVS
jgi:hypothetical protein